MQLSIVKRIRRSSIIFRKYILDTYNYLKIMHDESNYMKLRQKSWENMSQQQK